MIKFRLKQEPPTIDDAKLIILVQEHEFLYNPKNPDYRNLPQRGLVWSSIAKALNIQDQNLIQKRWKVIREKFSVSYRKQNSDGIQPTWPHYDSCIFLEPFVNLKQFETKKEQEDFEEEPTQNLTSLQKTPFDELTLTRLVKERPVLYDKHHEDFRSSGCRKKAWIEVSKAIGWDVGTIQKKWRVMRDRFVRELRRTKNCESDMQYSCTGFFKEMLFLVIHVRSKKYIAEADFTGDEGSQEQWGQDTSISDPLETCIVADETASAAEIIDDTSCQVTFDDEQEFEEIFEEADENYEDDFYEEEDCGEQTAVDANILNQHDVVVQEIPAEQWFKSSKKRKLSLNLQQDQNGKPEPVTSSPVRPDSPKQSTSSLVKPRISEAHEAPTDEDMAFGHTIGLMLKKIPQNLKTAVKLKLLTSLAEFEAQNKLS